MAIHPSVLVTADRRIRVEADPAGTRFVIWLDGLEYGRATSLDAVQALLAELGVNLDDLEPW